MLLLNFELFFFICSLFVSSIPVKPKTEYRKLLVHKDKQCNLAYLPIILTTFLPFIGVTPLTSVVLKPLCVSLANTLFYLVLTVSNVIAKITYQVSKNSTRLFVLFLFFVDIGDTIFSFKRTVPSK